MTESGLTTIRIVLVEPAGALNVGSIARVMKNMGLQHLVLVNPKCDPGGEEARLMAVHAVDVLEAATVVSTLPEALRGCQRAIATTARPRVATVLEPPRIALSWLLESPLQEQGALIFGPEDRGLSNEELNYAQRFITIPSHPDYAALNLAQAVAICCYELYHHEAEGRRQRARDNAIGFTGEAGVNNVRERQTAEEQQAPTSETAKTPNSRFPTPPAPPASLDLLEGYYQQLETVLLAIGYLHPHTAASRMQKFRRLFNRALPSSEEVAMLRGILSQVEWAVKKPEKRKNIPSSAPSPTDDG